MNVGGRALACVALATLSACKQEAVEPTAKVVRPVKTVLVAAPDALEPGERDEVRTLASLAHLRDEEVQVLDSAERTVDPLAQLGRRRPLLPARQGLPHLPVEEGADTTDRLAELYINAAHWEGLLHDESFISAYVAITCMLFSSIALHRTGPDSTMRKALLIGQHLVYPIFVTATVISVWYVKIRS